MSTEDFLKGVEPAPRRGDGEWARAIAATPAAPSAGVMLPAMPEHVLADLQSASEHLNMWKDGECNYVPKNGYDEPGRKPATIADVKRAAKYLAPRLHKASFALQDYFAAIDKIAALAQPAPVQPESDYEALEREHMGDPEKRTGIYSPRNRLGSWLSAALEDPAVCEAMKSDIRDWFASIEPAPVQAGAQQAVAAYLLTRPSGFSWVLMPFDITPYTRAIFEAEGTTITPLHAAPTQAGAGAGKS